MRPRQRGRAAKRTKLVITSAIRALGSRVNRRKGRAVAEKCDFVISCFSREPPSVASARVL